MKSLCVATVLLLSAAAANAETLDETFDTLGQKLQDVQNSLSPPSPSGAVGATFQLRSSTPIYTQPSTNAATHMKLDANAPVTVQGFENEFARVTTESVQGEFYVPKSDLSSMLWGGYKPTSPSSGQTKTTAQTSAQTGVISDYVLKTAFEKVKGVADYLQNNPYVRLKGFSVDISLPPSLKLELEMREASANSVPAATSAPKPKP
jgi:hypothetical protein